MVDELCFNHPTCDLKLSLIHFSYLNIILMLSGCWWQYYDSESHFRPQPCVYGCWLQTHGDGQRYSTPPPAPTPWSRIKGCKSSRSDTEYREQRKHSEPVYGNILFHSFYMHSGWSLNVMVVITVVVNSNSIGN